MKDVVRKCGIPDEHQGSGIYIFLYDMNDGSVVVIGTADLDHLMYVDHIDKRGSGSLLREVHEVSQALIGKQITIRGKFSLNGVIGPYVLLDNQQEVYLVVRESFTWGPPYAEMQGKVVEATGILKFYHRPDDAPRTDKQGRLVARSPDFFYFERETTQLRLANQ